MPRRSAKGKEGETNMFLGWIVLAVLLLSPAAGGAPVSMRHSPFFVLAKDRLAEGRSLEALPLFRDIAEGPYVDEEKAYALLAVGDIYALYLESHEAALDAYRDFLLRFPESPLVPTARYQIAWVLLGMERFDEAARAFRLFLEKHGDDPRAPTVRYLLERGLEEEKKKRPGAAGGQFPIASDRVRVLLEEGVSRVALGSAALVRGEGARDLQLPAGSALEIDHAGGEIRVAGRGPGGRERRASRRFVIAPLSGGRGAAPRLRLNGKSLDGDCLLLVDGGRVIAVNRLPIESYLRGVVPKEVPPSWPPAALRAQAIAARTYAIFHMLKNRTKAYDLLPTVSSQVYGGPEAARSETDEAIRETAGRILLCDGRPILAVFHASSGGRTVSAREEWGGDLPYLIAQDDPFSTNDPYRDWTAEISAARITESLVRERGLPGDLVRLVVERDEARKRARRLRIETTAGRSALRANLARNLLGPAVVKSTLFSVDRSARGFRFRGSGFGHGVGMSQWGAKTMAAEGRAAEELLAFYYPHTAIGRLRMSGDDERR